MLHPARLRILAGAVLLAVSTAYCGEGTGVAEAPEAVLIVSGDEQFGIIETELPDSLLVQVLDRAGNPMPGVTVTWSTTAPGATLSRTTHATTATGHASTKLTFGTQGGPFVVTATAGDASTTFDVRAGGGAPHSMAIHAGDGQTAMVATAVPIHPAVRVLDVYGNPVYNVTVAFTPLDGSYSLREDWTDLDGVATVSWAMASQVRTNHLEARVDGLPVVTFTATGTPAAASRLVKVAGDNQRAPASAEVPVDPTVRVTDEHGNGVAGTTVTFSVISGGGSATGTTVTSDANGNASVGSWTLGSAKGTNELRASFPGVWAPVTFTATAGEFSPNINVVIHNPQAGALVGDQPTVSVSVSSLYSVASVRAVVGTASADLTYSATTQRWQGSISLQGQPRDSLVLVVTARDVFGAATDAIRKILHDNPPTIEIISPLAGSVGRPGFQINVVCRDDDPAGCTSVAVGARGTVRASGTTQINTSLTFPPADGDNIVVFFRGTDSRGQSVLIERRVYVEPSTRLREIVSDGAQAIDQRGDRFFFRDATEVLFVKQISTDATEMIPIGAFRTTTEGYVTPDVVIFRGGGNGTPERLMEWRTGILTDLQPWGGLEVAGDYAVFGSGGTLVRRTLSTGTNTQVAASGNLGNVAINGDVAYWSTDYRVYWYRNGTTTLLTPNDGSGLWNIFPVTDGVSVVYERRTPCCANPSIQIVLHNGTTETVLAPAQSQDVEPGDDYAVNNGWTAFTKVDAGGAKQVWTRSPAGVLTQVSFFGSSSRISALGSDGTVIFAHGARYMVRPGGTAQQVMGLLGKVVWRDGRFVALIGNTAFEILPP